MVFVGTEADSMSRTEDLEDIVMYTVGTWAMLLASFVQPLMASEGLHGHAVYRQTLTRMVKTLRS
jgi:hypothetical protein